LTGKKKKGWHNKILLDNGNLTTSKRGKGNSYCCLKGGDIKVGGGEEITRGQVKVTFPLGAYINEGNIGEQIRKVVGIILLDIVVKVQTQKGHRRKGGGGGKGILRYCELLSEQDRNKTTSRGFLMAPSLGGRKTKGWKKKREPLCPR